MKLKQTDFPFAAPAAGLLTALCIILLTSRHPFSAAGDFFYGALRLDILFRLVA